MHDSTKEHNGWKKFYYDDNDILFFFSTRERDGNNIGNPLLEKEVRSSEVDTLARMKNNNGQSIRLDVKTRDICLRLWSLGP